MTDIDRVQPQTTGDTELFGFLKEFRNARETGRKPVDFTYTCVEDYVLKHGTFFTPSGLPTSIRPMRLSQCFENAWRVAQRSKAYHYVEGFAINIIPVLHAWLVDRDGNAYDPTWASLEDRQLGISYFGVELNIEEVRLSRRQGCSSLLEDYRRGYPALTGTDVLAKEAWFKR